MTTDNLVDELRTMLTHLEGIDERFWDDLAKVKGKECEEAGALLRGILFVCTSIHDVLIEPSLLGFSGSKSLEVINLLTALDPKKLAPFVIHALFHDCMRLLDDNGSVPKRLLREFALYAHEPDDEDDEDEARADEAADREAKDHNEQLEADARGEAANNGEL